MTQDPLTQWYKTHDPREYATVNASEDGTVSASYWNYNHNPQAPYDVRVYEFCSTGASRVRLVVFYEVA